MIGDQCVLSKSKMIAMSIGPFVVSTGTTSIGSRKLSAVAASGFVGYA